MFWSKLNVFLKCKTHCLSSKLKSFKTDKSQKEVQGKKKELKFPKKDRLTQNITHIEIQSTQSYVEKTLKNKQKIPKKIKEKLTSLNRQAECLQHCNWVIAKQMLEIIL